MGQALKIAIAPARSPVPTGPGVSSGRYIQLPRFATGFTTSDATAALRELFNCFDNSDLPIDASLLGDAFTTDAEGNVILAWQAGNTPKPPEPSISIRSTNGDTIWVQTGGGDKNDTILYVDYQNMGDETPEVQWSFSASNEGAAAWVETTQDSDVKGYVGHRRQGRRGECNATDTYDGRSTQMTIP